MRKYLLITIFIFWGLTAAAQKIEGTFLVASRDTCDLYMDYYRPAPGSETRIGDKEKPTIVFVFGGGFIMGSRNDKFYMPWFKLLTDDGYGVVSVDYRLGLKGVKMNFDLFHILDSAKLTKKAVDMGVEDVFSAIRFIIDNQDALGIDPGNLVIAGSSAGAIISLTCMLETCSPTERTAILPEGFRFKGVMSFAGAIMSDSGVPKYQSEPGPQLLFHGTDDGAVNYDKTAFGRYGFYGSSALVKDVYSKKGYCYQIFRYLGNSHEIAANMVPTWPIQKAFLETNVVMGKRRIIDATLDDPTLYRWEQSITLKQIYKK
ncbi:MAG: carboxylesterase family protein [Bacteroidales bacterium]|nr:carboxylesterase family protein [Bacteroidales bacterium]